MAQNPLIEKIQNLSEEQAKIALIQLAEHYHDLISLAVNCAKNNSKQERPRGLYR